jgi:predicted ATPase
MYIFLIGSHGTGKSSILYHLREKYEILSLESESRPLIRAGVDKLLKPLEYQYLLDDLLINTQKSFLGHQGKVYFTRCVLDAIAYGRTNLKEFLYNESNPSKFYKRIKDRSLFFYVPIEFPITEDPERPGDKEYQDKVDREIVKVLRDYYVPYMEVRGSIKDRAEMIYKVVNDL